MSIKKIALGFALAGIVGASSMLAENEGSFVGLQIGSGTRDVTVTYDWGAYGTESASASDTKSRFGLVFGSYAAIDETMGYRIYGFGDLGDKLYNINANMDFLYTFVNFEKVELRGFAGAYVGGVFYTDVKIDGKDDLFWGIDAGLNVGVRAVIAQRHGIDLFYRYGFLEPETEFTHANNSKTTLSIQQSLLGVRYTFSF